ncbi:11135_t:CDS:1, partial [Funneliformis mosseae]
KPIPLTMLINIEEGTSTSKDKKPQRKIPRIPSAVDQLASYN